MKVFRAYYKGVRVIFEPIEGYHYHAGLAIYPNCGGWFRVDSWELKILKGEFEFPTFIWGCYEKIWQNRLTSWVYMGRRDERFEFNRT